MRKLVCIVEGETEVQAVPILVRKWLRANDINNFMVQPHNCGGKGQLLCKPERMRGIEYHVDMALRQDPSAILVVLDADKDCFSRDIPLATELLNRSLVRIKEHFRREVPVRVVVANRHFETWIVASWYAIGPALGYALAPSQSKLETLEEDGCAAEVQRLMGDRVTHKYKKSIHPGKFAQHMPSEGHALVLAPSYARLFRALRAIDEVTQFLVPIISYR